MKHVALEPSGSRPGCSRNSEGRGAIRAEVGAARPRSLSALWGRIASWQLPVVLCDWKKRGGIKGKNGARCCRRAGHGEDVGHDYDKERRERVVSRILLLMARPGQTTGPLFRPVGKAVEMECMRAFREEWGSCVENGFKDFDKAKKEALWKEWSKRVDENFARKVKSGLLSRRCAGPCAGMRWGSGTSASVPAARVPQFTRAIASQCGAAWSRTGTSSTAAGRSSVRWHIRTSGGSDWCNMVGSSWAEVQQRGICAYIVPPI